MRKKWRNLAILSGITIVIGTIASGLVLFTDILPGTGQSSSTAEDLRISKLNAQTAPQPAWDYHVSDNMPIGRVVKAPAEIQSGIYMLMIEVEHGSKTSTVYTALTTQPELFPWGSPATLMNITANGVNVSLDMFHVAVRPGKNEKQ